MALPNRTSIESYLLFNFDFAKRNRLNYNKVKKVSLKTAKFYKNLIKDLIKDPDRLINKYLLGYESFLDYYKTFKGETTNDFIQHIYRTNRKNLLKKELKNQIILDIKYFCELIKVKCFTEKNYNSIYRHFKKYTKFRKSYITQLTDYIGLVDLAVNTELETMAESKKFNSIFDIFNIPIVTITKVSEVKKAITSVLTSLRAFGELENIEYYIKEINDELRREKNKNLNEIFGKTILNFFLDFQDSTFYLNKLYKSSKQ